MKVAKNNYRLSKMDNQTEFFQKWGLSNSANDIDIIIRKAKG